MLRTVSRMWTRLIIAPSLPSRSYRGSPAQMTAQRAQWRNNSHIFFKPQTCSRSVNTLITQFSVDLHEEDISRFDQDIKKYGINLTADQLAKLRTNPSRNTHSLGVLLSEYFKPEIVKNSPALKKEVTSIVNISLENMAYLGDIKGSLQILKWSNPVFSLTAKWVADAIALHKQTDDLLKNRFHKQPLPKLTSLTAPHYSSVGKMPQIKYRSFSYSKNTDEKTSANQDTKAKMASPILAKSIELKLIELKKDFQAISILQKKNPSHPQLANLLADLDKRYQILENQLNMILFEKELLNLKNLHGEYHIETAKLLQRLGAVYFVLENFDNSKDSYEKAIVIYTKVFGIRNNLNIAVCLHNLGIVYLHAENLLKAKEAVEEALYILKHHFPQYNEALNKVAKTLEIICFKLQNKDIKENKQNPTLNILDGDICSEDTLNKASFESQTKPKI